MPRLEEGLYALAQDLNDPYRLESCTLERALISDPPACSGALALDGDSLRGVALFSPLMSTALGSPGVYVSDLWITPEARGAGVGHVLLGWVAARASHLWGSGFMRLAAYEDNPRSIAFYERLGFTRPNGETSLRLSGAGFETLMRTT
ncbi:GNAT family N-acetyltransferase [Sulfitobacter sp. JB4-11]|uniref:GNAT family N-acetyltransferase n=1 Tax=Sulfitobacter rhodophyticola TaxID=3238304 RepID=UPI003D815D23